MTNGEVILKLIKDVGGIELELGEEFNIGCNLLKVTQEGLFNVYNGCICDVSLQEFIEDIKTIKVKPKFPKEGTRYYFVGENGCILNYDFDRTWRFDLYNYKIGNFFPTLEEAKQNKDKLLEFLNNPEKGGI